MERLTNHGAEGAAELIISDELSFDGEWCYDKEYTYEALGTKIQCAFERLSDYEDTGLLPAAVRAMQRAYTTMAGRVQKAELEKEEAMKLAESRYRYIRSLGSAIEQGYDDHEHLEQLLAQCDEERKRYKDEVEALKSEMRKEGTL